MGDRAGLKGIGLFFAVLIGAALIAFLQGPPRSTPRREQFDQALAQAGGGPAAGGVAAAEPLQVTIQLEAGEFEIVPIETGGAIHVQADYDEALSRLEHDFDAADGAAGHFRLSFTPRNAWRHARHAVGELTGRGRDGGERRDHSESARVRVELPTGVPMSLELDVGKGSTRIDLSGLSLHRLTLEHAMGDTDLRLTQPNPLVMDELFVHGKMGDLTVSGLGHAHARQLDFKGQMGSYELDFDGDWQVDLEGSISIIMGDARVDVPRDIALDLPNRQVIFGGLETSAARDRRNAEATGPQHSATLETRVRFGNLSIR